MKYLIYIDWMILFRQKAMARGVGSDEDVIMQLMPQRTFIATVCNFSRPHIHDIGTWDYTEVYAAMEESAAIYLLKDNDRSDNMDLSAERAEELIVGLMRTIAMMCEFVIMQTEASLSEYNISLFDYHLSGWGNGDDYAIFSPRASDSLVIG